MRRSTIIGIAALVVMVFCVPALAQYGVIKWEQLPDIEDGFDLQSQWDRMGGEPDVIKADDWICQDGLPITDIHWWGSYYDNEQFEPDAFYINIYANDPKATGPEDDMPGTLRSSYWMAFSAVNEIDTGQTDSVGEKVYYYSVYLDETVWFDQEQGVKYWISIVADTPDIGSTPIWGWHTGFEPDVQGLTNAVTGKVLQDSAWAEGNPLEWAHMSYNMAFSLTTIPEPGAYALFGLGALALLVLRRRKK